MKSKIGGEMRSYDGPLRLTDSLKFSAREHAGGNAQGRFDVVTVFNCKKVVVPILRM